MFYQLVVEVCAGWIFLGAWPRAYPDPLAGKFKFVVGGVGCKDEPIS